MSIALCPIKLYIYFGKSPYHVALVLRRQGREWQMIRWDTDTDEFTEGQWLKHARINIADSRMSETGELFRCCAKYHSWTAYRTISKIPYFTAVDVAESRGYGVYERTKISSEWKQGDEKGIKWTKADMHEGGAGLNWNGTVPSLPCPVQLLHHRNGNNYAIQSGQLQKNGILLKDFTSNCFENIVAPYAPALELFTAQARTY